MVLQTYLAFVAACLAITIVPGPTVTLVVANSLTHGTRAGLLNVVGTQIGIAFLITVLAIGLASVVATLAPVFDWVKLAGAAYCAGSVPGSSCGRHRLKMASPLAHPAAASSFRGCWSS